LHAGPGQTGVLQEAIAETGRELDRGGGAGEQTGEALQRIEDERAAVVIISNWAE
jgi:hypothetical protein